MKSLRQSTVWRVSFVIGLGALAAAPTPGDVGGCGQHPDLLDGPTFFQRKHDIDCKRCSDCDVHTHFCGDACAGHHEDPGFPDGCFPLVHDGEVCLNAIESSSCGEYDDYSRDDGRVLPSECQFCPEVAP